MPRSTQVRAIRRPLSSGMLLTLALALPGLVFLAALLVVPMARVVAWSLDWPHLSLNEYRRVFESSAARKSIVTTLEISLVVTLICSVLGYIYAYVLAHSRGWAFKILMAACILPFATSIVARSFSWVILLQPNGPVNSVLQTLHLTSEPLHLLRSWPAVIIGLSQVLLPYIVLPAYLNMAKFDNRLRLAAESLGASRSVSFWTVYLPMTLPGFLAGCLLVFVLAAGFYITPALLGDPRQTMIGQLIVQQVQRLLDWQFASALTCVLILLVSLVIWVSSMVRRLGDQ